MLSADKPKGKVNLARMAEGIDHNSQILAFVLDSLQVVSYKWLSRKFSISSNESKRLLQSVAEQHGSSMDIIYAVSGWTKADRHCYSVKLVPKSKLQEAKDMLDGHISIHVYSIQPCIPKDPAELWNAEYIQSEELFKQPSELNNCLRDNRFSAVSCSSVARKVIETCSAGNARLAAPKIAASSSSFSKVAAPSSSPPKASIVQAEVLAAQAPTSGPSKESVQGNNVVDVGTIAKGSGALAGPATKAVSGTKKKTAGSGDSALANLWGRASSKPKLEARLAAAANTGAVESSERAHDYPVDSSSDEEPSNFARIRRGDVKNSSKRTRQMIVDDDMSDEENADLNDDNIVGLSSPEVPIEKLDNPTLSAKNGKQLDASVPHLKEVKMDSFDDILEKEKPPEKKASTAEEETSKSAKVDKNEPSTVAPEPKKRKVLKTRIDERGREVTEVVWETVNPIISDGNKEDNCLSGADAHPHAQMGPPKAPSARPMGSASAKASNAAMQNPATKSSANKSTGKGASKDPQQGRISSFFKKKS